VLPGYDIDAVELSYLRHVLDDEIKRVRIDKPARVSFRVLEAVSYSLPLFLSFAYLLGSVEPRLAAAMHALANNAKDHLGGLVLSVLAAITALFVANLPLFTNAYRQWRLSRRLTALRLLDSAMLPPPRLGLMPVAVFILLEVLILFLHSIFGERGDSPPRGVVAATLLVLWPLAPFLADGLLRRLRGRLQYFEELRSLRSRLAAAENSNAGPALAPDLVIRLADMERTRRLRGSAEAVDELSSGSETSYAVSKSDSAAATLRGLDDSERLTIERALVELASRQEMSKEIVKTGPPSTLHVVGTSWQLVYEVKLATRIIHIITIRTLRDYA
jgi:hypothetical protein